MAQIVVTTGERFCDIDALACVIAYQEIPSQPAIPVISGPLNQSVSKEIREWKINYLTTIKDKGFDYVIVDVSEKSQLPAFVNQERIIEIYDHHFGFEKPWQEKLGPKAKIEEIGACATLIWEEYQARKPKQKITALAANLLYTAIVSNTLNFQASITTARDKNAFEELKPLTNLPKNWIATYYLDQEKEIYRKPETVIKNDTKIQTIKGMKCAFGQLELWNSRDFLTENANRVEAILKEFGTETWLLSSPCISEGRNYIFTKNPILKNQLSKTMPISFEGNIGITKILYLRKEILQKIQ
ncbi:MAG TPA: hypothetical protein VMW25_05565 [Clostridia bacterium]|nr:hypothetical protein [Clostridia bacterium]